MNPSTLLTIPQACAYLGIHEATLRRWKAKGKIRAVKIGGKVRYAKRDLIKVIER